MSSSWHSYPKVYNVGHPAVASILDGDVVIQEKVDGSQFSFGLHDGELKLRSKGRGFTIGTQDKMFDKAVETVAHVEDTRGLFDGLTYRCEYLMAPKHNTLCYDEIPTRNLVLFDVEQSESSFLDIDEIVSESTRLGIDNIPTLYKGPGNKVTSEVIDLLMEKTSFLGGTKIEGIVIKNYNQFTRDGKVMMAKFVSEKFKEVHNADWKDRHPGKLDIYQMLTRVYRTPARWSKAVHHMRDDGRLTNSPRDIGELIKEVQRDIIDECGDEIKQKLFNHAWKTIGRGVTRGLPEWYKEELLKEQLNEGD
jgi:hypothetical protein